MLGLALRFSFRYRITRINSSRSTPTEIPTITAWFLYQLAVGLLAMEPGISVGRLVAVVDVLLSAVREVIKNITESMKQCLGN